MNSFLDKYEKTSWVDISSRIELSTRDDVENALKTDGRCGLGIAVGKQERLRTPMGIKSRRRGCCV